MGDWFQSIVAKESQVEHPEFLASKIHKWLVQEMVIEARSTSCVLSETGLGYPPGQNYEKIVDKSQYAHNPQEELVNGLEIITSRNVFFSGQGEIEIRCPKCRMRCSDNWGEAINNWFENIGKGLIVCHHCGNSQTIIEWDFVPPWGFSNLGFTFWNWPKLDNSFINDLSQKLGLPIIFIAGKL